MKKIKPTIKGKKNYFPNTDLLMMAGDIYGIDEGKHKHENCTQIIYVVRGSIDITTESGRETFIAGEVVNIPPGEWHKVEVLTVSTRILMLKYRSTGVDIIKELADDYRRRKT